jgi:hypothetical protein
MSEPEDLERDPSVLARAATKQVRTLQRAVDRYNRILVVAVSACVILIIVSVFTVIGYFSNRATSDANQQLLQTQKAGSITSCESGNTARATNEKIWDEFLTLLVDNPQTAKTRTQLDSMIAALGLPASTQRGFDELITVNWTNNPADVAIVKGFEAYIAAHEKMQNCPKVYGS